MRWSHQLQDSRAVSALRSERLALNTIERLQALGVETEARRQTE